ncbi:HAD-IA family hydrolase [Kitasatospora sp. NPDC096077]|uniref:HAD-IA family hydrolase n=1 Tax=Kitasatospora sp. NPDC096077 TaxID=3155544 RepID=UPI00331D3FDB
MDPGTPGALLCDIDGVIRSFDYTEVARLEQAAGLAAGTAADIAFAPEQDLPLLLGRITRAEWAAAIAAVLARQVSAVRARELADAFAQVPSRVDAEVVALVRQVRGRVPVVLVSNATPWLDQDLDRLGLADLAAHVVNSSRVGLVKPDPAIYHLAAARAGVVPGRCLFVDDLAVNVEAARAVGMTAVHYRDPDTLRDALAPLLGRVATADQGHG